MVSKWEFFLKNKIKKLKKNSFLSFTFPSFNVFYLMHLIARNYFKNYGAIFIDFVLPIIIISILFNILPADFLRIMVPGVIISTVISSSFLSFAMAIFQWKKSVIYKKIQISQISTIQFFVAFLIFYSFTSFLSFLIAFFLIVIYDLAGLEGLKYFREDLKTVKLGLLVLGVVLTILTAISLGILIAFLCKSFNAVLAIGLGFFLIQAFVLGMYSSLQMVAQKDEMTRFSWFNPLYPGVRIFQLAWLENIELSFPKKEQTGWFLVDNSQQIVVLKGDFEDRVDNNFAYFDTLISLLNSSEIAKITKAQIILEDGTGITFEKILENQTLNNNVKNQLIKMWTIFQSEQLIWSKDVNLWKINLIKDFKILHNYKNYRDIVIINFIRYHEVHYNQSYWSFMPLFLGQFFLINSLNFGISKFFK